MSLPDLSTRANFLASPTLIFWLRTHIGLDGLVHLYFFDKPPSPW